MNFMHVYSICACVASCSIAVCLDWTRQTAAIFGSCSMVEDRSLHRCIPRRRSSLPGTFRICQENYTDVQAVLGFDCVRQPSKVVMQLGLDHGFRFMLRTTKRLPVFWKMIFSSDMKQYEYFYFLLFHEFWLCLFLFLTWMSPVLVFWRQRIRHFIWWKEGSFWCQPKMPTIGSCRMLHDLFCGKSLSGKTQRLWVMTCF